MMIDQSSEPPSAEFATYTHVLSSSPGQLVVSAKTRGAITIIDHPGKLVIIFQTALEENRLVERTSFRNIYYKS